MADLINRAALKDYISNLWDMQDAYLPCHFFDAMDDMPTVDAESVKHGHWVWKTDDYVHIICSKCGYDYSGVMAGDFIFCESLNYCPCCGAKMDEEVGE